MMDTKISYDDIIRILIDKVHVAKDGFSGELKIVGLFNATQAIYDLLNKETQ